ncbi:hypothetical protein GFK82_00657 [Candidatus Steffania adelgidicola]|nr:hypothetical protein GFK82_00657 [Candidatus Steffania adelgidicola]
MISLKLTVSLILAMSAVLYRDSICTLTMLSGCMGSLPFREVSSSFQVRSLSSEIFFDSCNYRSYIMLFLLRLQNIMMLMGSECG